MASIPMTTVGAVVAVLPPKPYSFTPPGETSARVGTSRKAFISTGFDQEPIMCKFAEDRANLHVEMEGLSLGDQVQVSGTVQGNAISVTSLLVVERAAA